MNSHPFGCGRPAARREIGDIRGSLFSYAFEIDFASE
jgi:hypothetical protein